MKLLVLQIIFLNYASLYSFSSKNLIKLDEESWRDLLTGEWMVEFHAPWCPACKDLQRAWRSFSDLSQELHIKVAEVDVTLNPGLSGRFLVTALPTIYHVKEGVFRQYSGSRDKNDFIAYVEDKKWSLQDPIPNYKYPNSPQMTVVACFFKLSMYVRDKHNYLVEEVGLPLVASYAIFAGITLTLGCALGFVIVCVIDQIFPTSEQPRKNSNRKEQKARGRKDEQRKKGNEKEKGQNSSDDKTLDDEPSTNIRNRIGTGNESTNNSSKNEEKKKK